MNMQQIRTCLKEMRALSEALETSCKELKLPEDATIFLDISLNSEGDVKLVPLEIPKKKSWLQKIFKKR
jgi:hypothetical protein